MNRKLISRKHCAELLNLHKRTIDRYLRNNRIEGFKPHGSSRVLIYYDSINQENLQSVAPKFNNKL